MEIRRFLMVSEKEIHCIPLASGLADRLGIHDSETTLLIEHYLSTAWDQGFKFANEIMDVEGDSL
jgi:hypothetical protein